MKDLTLEARYNSALTLDQFVAQAAANHELWATFAKRAAPDADLVARVNRLSARRHLLVLLEDWCGDAVNTIPALAALAETAGGCGQCAGGRGGRVSGAGADRTRLRRMCRSPAGTCAAHLQARVPLRRRPAPPGSPPAAG